MGLRVRGSIVASRLDYAAGTWGAEARDLLLERLTPAERRRAAGVALDGDWFAAETLARLDGAIVRELNGGDPSVLRELGRASAERSFPRLRTVLDGRADCVLARLARLNMFQDFGSFAVEPPAGTGEHGGAIVCSYPEGVPELYCASAVGFFERTLELMGYGGVRVAEVECQSSGAGAHRYELRWTSEPPRRAPASRTLETASHAVKARGTGRRPEPSVPARAPQRRAVRSLALAAAFAVVAAVLAVRVWSAPDTVERGAAAPPREYACSGGLVRGLTYGAPEFRFETAEPAVDLKITAHQNGRSFWYQAGGTTPETPLEVPLTSFAGAAGAKADPDDPPPYVVFEWLAGGRSLRCECSLR